MGLIRQARIPIPSLVHEHLGVIDDRHVVRHCKAKQPEQQQQASPPPQQASIQFTDQQLLYHIMDQNVANHRA
ncbi:hypothetical protein A2U01_0076746, partial [Trifolium medium]|nr:hypothetical protein [Trifolium medium]